MKTTYLPISIVITNYNRVNFLKKCIDLINERTRYPFRIIVVDSNSTDGSRDYLKNCKTLGTIYDHVLLEENNGQGYALTKGYEKVEEWEERRPSDSLFVTSNEDLYVPLFKKGPCWLERMKHLFEKYEEEINLKGLAMRIERSSRMNINEEEDLIMLVKSFPNVYRMMRRSDVQVINGFSTLKHWESSIMAQKFQEDLKAKYALATHIYASHYDGFMTENKGFDKDDTSYWTYPGAEKVKLNEQKPYADTDPNTFTPIKINSNADKREHDLREEYWNITTGVQSEKEDRKKQPQRDELKKIVEEIYNENENATIIDLGCSRNKVHPKQIGIDTYPYDNVDIVHNVNDLWFFKDGEVDAITASHILEHFGNTKKILSEWDRVLKPGGTLAIIVPDGEKRPNTINEPSHKVAFTKDILKRLIVNHLNHKIINIGDGVHKDPRKTPIICISQKR